MCGSVHLTNVYGLNLKMGLAKPNKQTTERPIQWAVVALLFGENMNASGNCGYWRAQWPRRLRR